MLSSEHRGRGHERLLLRPASLSLRPRMLTRDSGREPIGGELHERGNMARCIPHHGIISSHEHVIT
jgi:hypothetical protein